MRRASCGAEGLFARECVGCVLDVWLCVGCEVDVDVVAAVCACEGGGEGVLTPSEDLLHHGTLARDGTVLRDGGVRVLTDGGALSLGREGRASSSHVFLGASPFRSSAEPLL